MSFSFNEYELFAKGLKESSSEVDLRNSVSRGYYCFYHKVKKKFGYLDSEFKPHRELIEKLATDERIIKKAKLSNAMQVMKEEREHADYHIFSTKHFKAKIEFNKSNISLFWSRYEYFVKLLGEESLD